ncbi:hypothetical protein [Pseudomonas sp. AN-1]|uniref:hypothetical protein n=1 Tax=Pseudomonas sp. AN-1 TaxID=3096605 RepID=UPI002A6AE041|nr:hypothetical protein [Pseudomonas sp. AN-1]WPP47703.1 hypothetical protein SK095_10210 [Pseudomonas sp. AN-1]
MPTIVSWKAAADQYTVYRLNAPEGATELCTLDGVTYTALPEGAELGEQPEQIAASVEVVTLDEVLRERICAASPHVALIRARVADKIAERYSITDEVKLLRTAPSAEFEAYNEYAESCRQWGRDRKAELGL